MEPDARGRRAKTPEIPIIGRPSPAFLSLLPVLGAVLFAVAPASAFSKFSGEYGAFAREGIIAVPLPPPSPPEDGETPGEEEPDAPASNGAGESEPSANDEEPAVGPVLPAEDGVPPSRPPEAAPLPIRYGAEGLSEPARDLRERLIEIARSGDIEKLRPYLETGAQATALSVVPIEGDPIEFLKDASGDGEGVELLAILLEILLAGHVQVEAGTENEIFVWPYFTQMPLDRLTKPQLVELFELVTAGDYQNMLGNGAYDFYRVGISPGGRLEFFLAGD